MLMWLNHTTLLLKIIRLLNKASFTRIWTAGIVTQVVMTLWNWENKLRLSSISETTWNIYYNLEITNDLGVNFKNNPGLLTSGLFRTKCSRMNQVKFVEDSL